MDGINQQQGFFQPIPEKDQTSYIYATPPKPRGLLVLGHGAGAGKDHPNIVAISEAMYDIGMAVFRYNFVYMELGKGREAAHQSVATVKEAVNYAHKMAPRLPIFVGGHSYGGRMSSHAAHDGFEVEVSGMIYFNFPLHAPGRPGNERGKHLKEISLPQLFLSGSRDTFSTSNFLENLLENTISPTKLVRLDSANHSYKTLKRSRKRTDSVFEEIGEAVDGWLKKLH